MGGAIKNVYIGYNRGDTNIIWNIGCVDTLTSYCVNFFVSNVIFVGIDGARPKMTI